jgi:hypothetical protein
MARAKGHYEYEAIAQHGGKDAGLVTMGQLSADKCRAAAKAKGCKMSIAVRRYYVSDGKVQS